MNACPGGGGGLRSRCDSGRRPVGHDKFAFERIELLEARIRRLAKDAAYVQVWDRTDRKNEQNLGRFDLTETDALPYLTERVQPTLAPDEDDDPYEGAFGEYDELEEDEVAVRVAARRAAHCHRRGHRPPRLPPPRALLPLGPLQARRELIVRQGGVLE